MSGRFNPTKGERFEYRFSIRDGRERHDWVIHNERGAIGIWAEPTTSRSFGDRWFGGIEVHAAQPSEYQDAENPSQERCWLINKPCWHDGSSLSFSERVEPFLPDPDGQPMPSHSSAMVLPILHDWKRSYLEAQAEDAEA